MPHPPFLFENGAGLLRSKTTQGP